MRLRSLLFSLLILTTVSTNSVSADGNDNSWAEFETHVTKFRVDKQIPGMAVAIVSNARPEGIVSIGFADSNKTIPITPDTPFWIASVTKTFVGLTYLHLAREQKIDLDELAADTPGFEGLCQWLASTSIPFAKGLDCDARIKIRHILHHQVNEPPGSQFMYNPIMYSRLSRHLENKFGDGIDAVEGKHNYLAHSIDKLILQPANMNRTMSSMWDRSRMDVYFDMANGFKVDEQGRKRKLPSPDRHIPGGAGVVSTINDLVKYERALQHGVIVPEGAMDILHKPARYSSGEPSPYGYGWYFQCYRGVKLMWHGGWDPDHGYSAIYLRIPDQKLALIALANSEGGLWWGNSLTEPQIQNSGLSKLFLDTFVEFPDEQDRKSCDL